ncbi:MAG: hypothetical protein ACREDF_11135 [Thermoplasmata archaeon]
MPLDPIFRVIRSVQGGGERRCLKCKRETLLVVEKMDEKRTGVLCRNCGWSRADLKSERHEIICAGDACGESMGFVELVEGASPKKYLCVKCTKDRREKKVDPDTEGTKIRHKMLCEGGCGTQTMWLDFPETEKGPAPEKLRGGFCKPCASKIKPNMLRNDNGDKIIREAVEEFKKKEAAGQPVTAGEVLGVVDKLMKSRR